MPTQTTLQEDDNDDFDDDNSKSISEYDSILTLFIKNL